MNQTPQQKKTCKFCRKDYSHRHFWKAEYLPNYICKHCVNRFGKEEVITSYNNFLASRKRTAANRKYKTEKKVSHYHRRWNNDPEYKAKMKQKIKEFRERYPEKVEAWQAIQYLPKPKGYNLHHWSYNPEHYTDIIIVSKEKHHIIHTFIEYDKETKMYKDKRSGFLLNTKSLHAAFLDLCLETYHGMKL